MTGDLVTGELSQLAQVLTALIETHESRKQEAAEAILFLSDVGACRMAACWKRVERTMLPAGNLPADETRRWEWCWRSVAYDLREWAAAASVPLPQARAMERVLISNRVVYPNGSMNSFATRWIGERVVELIEKRAKKKGRRR